MGTWLKGLLPIAFAACTATGCREVFREPGERLVCYTPCNDTILNEKINGKYEILYDITTSGSESSSDKSIHEFETGRTIAVPNGCACYLELDP